MSKNLQIIACGCPPAQNVDMLVQLAKESGWAPFVTLTPSATKWASVTALEGATGYPVRVDYRGANEPKLVPEGDALIVCPATVNTINKWAAGICDTLALGAMVEAIGRKIPIVAVPFSNSAHLGHPAFVRNIGDLRDWGVRVVMLNDSYMRTRLWLNSGHEENAWRIAINELDDLCSTLK